MAGVYQPAINTTATHQEIRPLATVLYETDDYTDELTDLLWPESPVDQIHDPGGAPDELRRLALDTMAGLLRRGPMPTVDVAHEAPLLTWSNAFTGKTMQVRFTAADQCQLLLTQDGEQKYYTSGPARSDYVQISMNWLIEGL